MPCIILTAAELDRGLALTVALEPASGGRLCWAVRVTGPPALASTLRLSMAGFVQLGAAVARAIDAAAIGWHVPATRPIMLAAVGEVSVGVGVAGGTLWAIVTVASEVLRLPAADLARLRDALGMAESRMARAAGASVQ